MQEDLSKLSKKEIDEKMSALSTETTVLYDKVAKTKPGSPEAEAAQVAYDAITAKYAELKAEYDKKVSS